MQRPQADKVPTPPPSENEISKPSPFLSPVDIDKPVFSYIDGQFRSRGIDRSPLPEKSLAQRNINATQKS